MNYFELIRECCKTKDNKNETLTTQKYSIHGCICWRIVNFYNKRIGSTTKYIAGDQISHYISDPHNSFVSKHFAEIDVPQFYKSNFFCYVACPLSFLDEVSIITNEAWREQVRGYHATKRRKLKIGSTYSLVGCIIPSIAIKSLKPLRGEYNSDTYSISKSRIGEELFT